MANDILQQVKKVAPTASGSDAMSEALIQQLAIQSQQLQKIGEYVRQMQTTIESKLATERKKWSWWSELVNPWPDIFKKAVDINSEPTAKQLNTIYSLSKLDCSERELANLEPLRVLTNLKILNCNRNLRNSQTDSSSEQFLEPLRALANLQVLNCTSNQLTSLKPLDGLENLCKLHCAYNPLDEKEIKRFKEERLKKTWPPCEVVFLKA